MSPLKWKNIYIYYIDQILEVCVFIMHAQYTWYEKINYEIEMIKLHLKCEVA